VLWVVYLDLVYWGIFINGILSVCGPPAFVQSSSDRLYLAVISVYLGAALVLFLLSLVMRPNANSLHPLYRDRLGTAFLFQPLQRLAAAATLESAPVNLTGISGRYGPYHLINTALNIQNSKVANKRGRNADFFVLTPHYVGSETTGYIATEDYSKLGWDIDLATAMAVSGAAASSNMGSQSIKPLTPTLALLNIRLGYWMRNPTKFPDPARKPRWLKWNLLANFYFLAELFGLLNEDRQSIYLTDGGHIENLGIYELLKRGCRVIIAVDAEADPEMAFGSFNTLVRYARIDLGLEIDLPWQQIADKTKATGKAIDEKGDTPKLHGPHCAIGQISDATGRKGILVYIKSSLTGDENDYVFDYKKRYKRFPQETTLDQMFTEEQFEAYRALGYHATNGFFDRRDDFAKLDLAEVPDARKQVMLLDELFPRVGGPSPHRAAFADWLPRVPIQVPPDNT
jgi:hypothetical protein